MDHHRPRRRPAPRPRLHPQPGPGQPGRDRRTHDALPQRQDRGSQHQDDQAANVRRAGFTPLPPNPARLPERKLTWDHVDLARGVIHVWQSASKTGDTKTPKSKRSLTLPRRAITALKAHKARQDREREEAGEAWQDNNLVFCHENGTVYTSDGLNWRFSKMTRKAGIGHWHAHEGRHTAVSIMSSNGVPIQEISDTVGHPRNRDRLPPRDRARDPRGSDGDGRTSSAPKTKKAPDQS
jgi:hypothetical protein